MLVGKNVSIELCRALVAHGEVVTWVSCHSDRPLWRHPTLSFEQNVQKVVI